MTKTIKAAKIARTHVKEKIPPVRQRLRADLDPAVWLLLERYLVVINDYLKEKGYPPTSQARLVGAVLTRFVLANETHINEQFTRIEVARVRRRIGGAAATDPVPDRRDTAARGSAEAADGHVRAAPSRKT